MQFRIFALLVGHILEAGLTTGEKAEDATYCAHATGSFRTFNIRYDRLEVALVSCALAFFHPWSGSEPGQQLARDQPRRTLRLS